jgi:hypothetical protein
MKLATAYRQLVRDSEFLGLKFEDLLQFIEEAPLAQTQATLQAYQVYRELSCV